MPHASWLKASVRLSKAQAPPAGSITRFSEDSCCNTSCVLRAMRRAKSSGSPKACVNGRTVKLSAPATEAAKVATVPRNMFTQGSRRACILADVTADSRIDRAMSASPQASATRPQSRRKARNLAIDIKKSVSTATVNSI